MHTVHTLHILHTFDACTLCICAYVDAVRIDAGHTLHTSHFFIASVPL